MDNLWPGIKNINVFRKDADRLTENHLLTKLHRTFENSSMLKKKAQHCLVYQKKFPDTSLIIAVYYKKHDPHIKSKAQQHADTGH